MGRVMSCSVDLIHVGIHRATLTSLVLDLNDTALVHQRLDVEGEGILRIRWRDDDTESAEPAR